MRTVKVIAPSGRVFDVSEGEAVVLCRTFGWTCRLRVVVSARSAAPGRTPEPVVHVRDEQIRSVGRAEQ